MIDKITATYSKFCLKRKIVKAREQNIMCKITQRNKNKSFYSKIYQHDNNQIVLSNSAVFSYDEIRGIDYLN